MIHVEFVTEWVISRLMESSWHSRVLIRISKTQQTGFLVNVEPVLTLLSIEPRISHPRSTNSREFIKNSKDRGFCQSRTCSHTTECRTSDQSSEYHELQRIHLHIKNPTDRGFGQSTTSSHITECRTSDKSSEYHELKRIHLIYHELQKIHLIYHELQRIHLIYHKLDRLGFFRGGSRW